MVLRNISEAKAELSKLIELAKKAKKWSSRRRVSSSPAGTVFRTDWSTDGGLPCKGKIRIAPDFDTLPADMEEAFGLR